MRQPIRNLHSTREVPPRCFDAILEDDNQVYLEVKKGTNHYDKILWSDVLYQMNMFIQKTMKLPQVAPR